MPHLMHTRYTELTQLTAKLHAAVYRELAPLTVTAWCSAEPLPFAERTHGRKQTLRVGDKWGGLFDCAWMHFTGRLPAGAAGHEIVLLIDVGGEACVFDRHGVPQQGLTNIHSEYDKTLGLPGKWVVPCARRGRAGQAVDLWVDAATNDLFGRLQNDGRLQRAAIAVRRGDLLALAYDYEVLEELMRQLPATGARHQQLLRGLCTVADLLAAHPDTDHAPAEVIRQARAILQPHLAQKGGDPSLTITAVGHSHMDLAWLWPLRETRRKCARTFATVLRNFERDPDYVYGASQPQQLQWVKEDHPAIYRALQRRAKEGRFDCQGGMWVESDTNVPSGESLVRQFLHGIRYWQQEFGVRVQNLWLPDVFGYSGALPQIMEQCGLPWFMTQKLSWSKINKFPHQSFWWQGIDGTRVLAHMLPEETYNSPASPRAIHKAEHNYLDADASSHALMLFGIGDGGGGPGEEHLERLAREKNLAGLAPVRQARADQFFAQWRTQCHRFATWQGELYLEYHQGTFTTQARNKRYNRQMEQALRNCEWLHALAGVLAPVGGQPYPHAELDRIWKEILLYQFHDILPGSSIKRVYDESLARYAALLAETETLTAAAVKRIAAALPASAAKKPRALFNTLAWDRQVVVRDGRRHLTATVPAGGATVVDLATTTRTSPQELIATADILENSLLKITSADDGTIDSIYDKEHHREILAAPGNRLLLWQDSNNAWDFPLHYRQVEPELLTPQDARWRLDGPCALVEQVYVFGRSRLTQTIRLTAGSRRIDFITRVDWHEQNKMLRVEFPTAIRATDATCEIQFGAIHRPTHTNTSWDAARIEVPAQKWVDLSEPNYGVALLNDCKYGYHLNGGVLDLNLLRGTSSPGVTADQGAHEFTYSLFPHPGDHVAGGVVREAHELNTPVVEFTPPRAAAAKTKAKASAPSAAPFGATTTRWFAIDTPDLVLDTVKQAEDGRGLILRLYEAHGSSGEARLTVNLPVTAARRANCLEAAVPDADLSHQPNPGVQRTANGVTLDIPYRPYELITLRVT